MKGKVIEFADSGEVGSASGEFAEPGTPSDFVKNVPGLLSRDVADGYVTLVVCVDTKRGIDSNSVMVASHQQQAKGALG